LDLNPATGVGQDPTYPPLTSGPRSAYGSVELLGTISTLTFNVNNGPIVPNGDGGSFTLSTSSAVVPEPSSLVIALTATACLATFAGRRLRKRSR